MFKEQAEQPWYQTAVIPGLLRHAQRAYGAAMRAALAAIGCDDMPKNGMYVIGGLAMGAGGVPLSQFVAELGVSKQAAGQLVDTLVLRGYLDRSIDTEDRRKLSIKLTTRGEAAAAAQGAARKRVDAQLAESVGSECVVEMRRALGALCRMGRIENDKDDH
ncbi:MAG TPA: MarR family transcriptional regulator [Acidobacteriaceae bacterium]|nr:MarR family transcriptional regulator [Acidobacteriaceae bacterium]